MRNNLDREIGTEILDNYIGIAIEWTWNPVTSVQVTNKKKDTAKFLK